MPRKASLGDYHHKITGSHNDPCVFCGAKATTIDHITPLAKDGRKHNIYNLAPMCAGCNNDKADSSILMALLHPQIKNRMQTNYKTECNIIRKEIARREWKQRNPQKN